MIQLIEEFERLSHNHLGWIVSTYMTPGYINIISTPAASFTLYEYLEEESLAPERNQVALTFFGCLASASRYVPNRALKIQCISLQDIMIERSRIFFNFADHHIKVGVEHAPF